MKGHELIQVYFRRSPTGKPFKLGYHANEYGFVRRQLVQPLMDAGVIDPVVLPEYDTKPEDFVPVSQLEEKAPTPDLSTVEGVAFFFGDNIEAMRAYCDEKGIKYGRTRTAAGFHKKIAKAD